MCHNIINICFRPKRDKKASAPSAPKKPTKDPLNRADPFNLINEEKAAIAEVRSSKRAAQLDSTFTQKVANGNLRRSLPCSGEFYLELRLYNTSEIATVAPAERWKKAVTALKTQIEVESPTWGHLHKLITNIDKQFMEVEPTFYSDKIQYK